MTPRRKFLKYIPPTILTFAVAPSFAQVGSRKPEHGKKKEGGGHREP